MHWSVTVLIHTFITLTTCKPQLVTEVLHWPILLQLIHKLVQVLRIHYNLSLQRIKKLTPLVMASVLESKMDFLVPL